MARSHKLGYYYLPEGRQLFTDISNSINKNRYSTTANENNIISIDDILKKSSEIFSQNPPFDINSGGKSHVELAQEFNKIQRALNPTVVYIYKNRTNRRISFYKLQLCTQISLTIRLER